MVKAYSRYSDSACAGLIHSDGSGQTVAWSSDGKSIFSAVGASVIEINAKTGAKVGTISCSETDLDEGLHTSSLSLRQPSRVSTLGVYGEYMCIGCTDGSVKVVNVVSSNFFRLTGHRGAVNCAVFGDNGSNILATGGRDTEIVVWDTLAEVGVCRLTGHKGEITGLVFLSRSDLLVSSSKDGTIKVWSIKLQLCVQTIACGTDVWSLGVCGSHLFVGSCERFLQVYKIVDDNLMINSDGLTVLVPFGNLDRPEPGDGRIVSISATGGKFVYCQTDRRVVEIWRIVSDQAEVTKRMKRRIKRQGSVEPESLDVPRASDFYVVASSVEAAAVALRYVATSKIKSMDVFNGVVALGLADNQIESFKCSVAEGGCAISATRSIKREGHRANISLLSLSSDTSRLLSVAGDSIIIWNGISLAFQRQIFSPFGSEILFVNWVNNDTLCVITRDGMFCHIDVNTGALVGESSCVLGEKRSLDSEKFVKCVSSAFENKIVIGDKNRRVCVLEIGANNTCTTHEIPDEPVCVSISPKTGMYIATGLLNSNIELVYTDTGKHYMSLFAHKLPVTSVCFSPDEQMVVSGSIDKNIKIWSIKFGNVLKSIRAHDAGITSLKFIPHTHLVWSAGRDGVVSLWDVDRFERVMSKVYSGEVLGIETSGDAGLVFSAAGCGIHQLTRSEEQMFIEEETEKAMELEVDGEAQRDDFKTESSVPTKSSLESVRLVERVVQMIEIDEEEINDAKIIFQKKKDLIKFITIDTHPSQLQQIIVSLPTGHARRLLSVIADVMENIQNAKTKKYPPGFPVEACVSAGLFLIQAQAKYLLGEHHSRAVLLRLGNLFHDAIQNEIENVGYATASMKFSHNL